jgi:tetratricopeptide (TPR) repeat protein
MVETGTGVVIMTLQTLISAYTPSNTDPCLLERILVQREKLLETMVRRMKHSMSSGDKYHVLLNGPRGCGKTHFLTLVHFRLTQDTSLADSMRVAWLGEDAVITSLVDLAMEMADQLASEYPSEFNADIRSKLHSLPPDDAAVAMFKDIVSRLGERHLLLLMENLDRAFLGLGEGGQKKWRAFLQETGKIATLATTQQLFDGVSKRDEAFFGFFDIYHLQPLSFEDALQLIINVAREYKKQDLVDFLGTSEGHFRIRALRHLAGGNHRMYIMLSEFLTKDSLDELVTAFEQLAEELTPYFQERLRSLPPQQARVVQSLCNAEGALTVKAVATDTFLPERNCSKHLGELKKKGFVICSRRGKESYYEMAEPIMRLCLEIKSQRGRPLRLIAQFLRAWFPAQALQSREGSGLLSCSRGDSYRTYALQVGNRFEEEIRTELSLEIEEKYRCGKLIEALRLADELHHADPIHCLSVKARIFHETRMFDDELSCLSKLIDISKSPVDQHAKALLNRAVMYGRQGKSDLALGDYTTLIETPDAPADQRAKALLNRGVMYGRQGKSDLALSDYTALIETPDAPPDQRATALLYRGITYGQQGKSDLEMSDYTALIETPDAPADQRAKALLNRGVMYGRQGKSDLEMSDYTALIETPDAPVDQRAKALLNRGAMYGLLGKIDLALSDYTALVETPDAPAEQRAKALLNRGVTYGQQGKSDLELSDYTALIETPDASADQRAKALIKRSGFYWRTERFELSLNDLSTLVATPSYPLNIRQKARFYIPESIIPTGAWSDAMDALTKAFDEGNPSADDYGGTPHDLLKMVLRKGYVEWGPCAAYLVKIYAHYGACDKLCSGLTRSIAYLDEGDYSDTQLDAWNAAWQDAGQQNEACEVALRSLRCATQAIKAHSDRPLFELPLEIRELVLPLLQKTCGKQGG